MSEVEESPAQRVKWPLSRQRLIEMAVVVFGVMIALGLENAVEEIRLRGDARDLEEAFRTDVFRAVKGSWERQVIAPCLTRNLSSLTERVIAADGAWQAAPAVSTGTIPFAMPQPYRVPSRVWTTTAFDRALGSEAFKRIPRERAEAYAGLFSMVELRREDNAAEYLATSSLAPLAFPQTGIDAEVRAALLQSLALADRHRGLALVQSNQIMAAALALRGGADIRAEVLARRAEFDESTENARTNYGDCIDPGATDRLMKAAAS
ncbi:hypothetical protein BH10PSE1_BH10PSE1_18230 [soil metagenome]